MRVSVFGLGYVGCVSLGCLAQDGHNVIGVDINQEKIDMINLGKPTIVEEKIDKIIAEQFKLKKIRATTKYKEAVLETDISIICVGTPTTDHGYLNLQFIFKVATEIGMALKDKDGFHTVVIRSTVTPGTNHKVSEIIEEESGKKRNTDFGVVSNPEFMREGSAVDDYYNPGIIVLGSNCERSVEMVKELTKSISASIEITEIGVAELIKYVNNSFHALKIVFANEVGNICKKMGVDSHKMFDVFCKDVKLNISPKYFRPGFAYGGSCLPKDLKALKTIARDYYLKCQVLDSINESNDNQIDIAFEMITSKGKRKIGMIGLSFKAGTDDLRFSPVVELVERLIGKGYRVMVYDANVYLSNLTGVNRTYVKQHIPHIADLMVDNMEQVIKESDVLVISHNYECLSGLIVKYPDRILVDLVGIGDEVSYHHYDGICW